MDTRVVSVPSEPGPGLCSPSRQGGDTNNSTEFGRVVETAGLCHQESPLRGALEDMPFTLCSQGCPGVLSRPICPEPVQSLFPSADGRGTLWESEEKCLAFGGRFFCSKQSSSLRLTLG